MEIMVGRPRRVSKRERNGRIQRVYENPRAQVASQPHRLSVRAEHREREEAESEFGRMMLHGKITPAQHEAGKLYRELAHRFRAVVLSAPMHTPQGLDYLGPAGRGVTAEMSQDAIDKLRERYDAAFVACGKAGNRAQRAVKDCAVFDRKLSFSEFYTLDLLRSGLDKLVEFFGLDASLRISERQK